MSPCPNLYAALRAVRRPVFAGIVALVCAASLAATAVVPVWASSSESGRGGSYVVEPGDTLSVVAQRFGTTVQALAAANGIEDPDLIVAGATLVVPSLRDEVETRAVAQPALDRVSTQRVGQRHEVRRGETLDQIASRYGMAESDLAEWNGIVRGRIYAGTRLILWDPGTIELAGGDEAVHTVALGETLGHIALRYGTTVRALQDANDISDANRLRAGTHLTVAEASGARCPVPGAHFVNDWGYPRSGGTGHAGNDLFAPSGSPVVAPVAGTVTVETGTIGGLQFWLTATDGTRWFGSHLDAFGATGEVEAGDIIGYVGDSGNAAGSRPHLHLELHPAGGSAANPYPLLRSIC